MSNRACGISRSPRTARASAALTRTSGSVGTTDPGGPGALQSAATLGVPYWNNRTPLKQFTYQMNSSRKLGLGQFARKVNGTDILTLSRREPFAVSRSKIELSIELRARHRKCFQIVVTDGKGQNNMKPELKDLMQDLQMAFNESVCESERIAEILAEIKGSGYDVLLALEVTIGMSAGKPEEAETAPVAASAASISGQCNFTDFDRQFLQTLHVAG